MELQRVQKIISNFGLMSRRKAEEYIEQGRVRVNGRIIKLGDKARLTDKITVDGRQIETIRRRYIMFYKPPNCLTTLSDPQHRPTILRYIKEKERLIPVGRLDFHTEGLLLLTNDGEFANKIMHPRYEVKKTYIVHLNKPLTDDHKQRIERGIELEEGRTRPCQVKYVNDDKDIVEITIHEGKKRIVRRLFFHFGYKTQRLIRIRIGRLYIGDLKKGAYRDITKKEIDLIFSGSNKPAKNS
ncbi:MAG: rRNA pseudouridine synthase [Nanoarchaeota archaeon]|nr:rRNA pseudouridine synthase [Nanoarchaeota archaeon]